MAYNFMSIYLVLGILGLVISLGIWQKWFGSIKKGPRALFTLIGLFLLVIGVWGTGTFSFIPNSEGQWFAGPFAAGAGVELPTTTTDTTTTTKAVAGKNQLAIETFKLAFFQKYSNDQTNLDGLYFKIYDKSLEPTDPSASPTLQIIVQNGAATDKNGTVLTDTPYRVVLDGKNVVYSKDYGIMEFPLANFNPNTATYSFIDREIPKIASFTNTKFTYANDTENTKTGPDVNGQTTCASGQELVCVAGTANTTFTYDESDGDGGVYIDFPLEVGGTQSEIQNPVLCFEHDSTNPPEGDELTSIAVSQVSGTPYFDSLSTNDLVSYWAIDRSCVSLNNGNTIKSGALGVFRLTLAITEANLDANDDWSIVVDDLGGILGKDVRLNTGATKIKRTFDAQA